jgi:hypothetical protein
MDRAMDNLNNFGSVREELKDFIGADMTGVEFVAVWNQLTVDRKMQLIDLVVKYVGFFGSEIPEEDVPMVSLAIQSSFIIGYLRAKHEEDLKRSPP